VSLQSVRRIERNQTKRFRLELASRLLSGLETLTGQRFEYDALLEYQSNLNTQS
jgi:hypothetical protein